MAAEASLGRDQVLSWLGHYVAEITPEMAAEDDWYASALSFAEDLIHKIEAGAFNARSGEEA